MGGNLSLIAEFPDQPPVVPSGITRDEPSKPAFSRKQLHAPA